MQALGTVSVVCFQWNEGLRDYRPEHVNVLARSFKRHLKRPHRFICVSDDSGFSDDVEVLPLPEEAKFAASLKTPHGPKFPSSYRRLWAFSKAAEALGDVILMTDIDCVITGPIDPLFHYMKATNANFVGWRPSTTWAGVKRVAGGTWLLRTGTHTEVWDNFSVQGLQKAQQAGQRGSDQSWISYCLADDCVVFPKTIGIYEAQWMRPNNFKFLPPSACIVHFNGKHEKPWNMLHIPWIKRHWN